LRQVKPTFQTMNSNYPLPKWRKSFLTQAALLLFSTKATNFTSKHILYLKNSKPRKAG
jgi:hypothetical protein